MTRISPAEARVAGPGGGRERDGALDRGARHVRGEVRGDGVEAFALALHLRGLAALPARIHHLHDLRVGLAEAGEDVRDVARRRVVGACRFEKLDSRERF